MRSCTSRSVHKAQEYSQGIIQGLLLTHASPVQRTSMLVDGGQPMNGATYLRFVSTSLSLSSAVWASAASAPKLASPSKPERAEAGLKQQQTAQHDLVSCASWCYWCHKRSSLQTTRSRLRLGLSWLWNSVRVVAADGMPACS